MRVQAASPTSSATKIREARFEDYTQIAALQARTGINSKTREEWEHLWRNNPVYKKLTNWTIGWVAENPDHGIVGYIGNIPLSFHFKGREIVSGCIHSMTMDEPHRGSAGFLLRRLLNYKVPELIVTTTANANSAKLNDAFRQPRVPTGDWSQSPFWITNYKGFIASALHSKGLPQVLSYPASYFLRLKDKLARADAWTRRNHQEIISCSAFDERFEQFWSDLKRAYPERLLATRSREVLQWHFKHALAKGRAWIVTAGDGSRLSAYAVFYRQDNAEHLLKRVRLVDFQDLNGDSEVLIAMIASGLARCRNEGIHMLGAFGFRPEKQSVIDNVAPYRRQFPNWWYYYKPVNKALAPELQNPEVWDPSHYDGDATL
ncbi:MAG: hypothetical protein WBM11_05570 [Terriglobales bacterium]